MRISNNFIYKKINKYNKYIKKIYIYLHIKSFFIYKYFFLYEKIALSLQLVRFFRKFCFRKLYLLRRAVSIPRFIETYPTL